MKQSINTDSKNSKEPQQKYRLGTVSIKILGGLNQDPDSVENVPDFYYVSSPQCGASVGVLFFRRK